MDNTIGIKENLKNMGIDLTSKAQIDFIKFVASLPKKSDTPNSTKDAVTHCIALILESHKREDELVKRYSEAFILFCNENGFKSSKKGLAELHETSNYIEALKARDNSINNLFKHLNTVSKRDSLKFVKSNEGRSKGGKNSAKYKIWEVEILEILNTFEHLTPRSQRVTFEDLAEKISLLEGMPDVSPSVPTIKRWLKEANKNNFTSIYKK
ncbi:hypothetical protein [Shewanella frigidimarina]|uniref:hypothetical protein n=1 Tax=Shewanella frigidimarina TaxID=56812 RepID=UPI003D798D94